MKRFLSMALILTLLLSALVLPASAASAASRVDSYITVHTNGDCQVTLTVTLRLDDLYGASVGALVRQIGPMSPPTPGRLTSAALQTI